MKCNLQERDEFSLDKTEANKNNILRMCREQGVCVVDSFLSDEEVAEVRGSIDKIYESIEETEGVSTHLKTEYQHALTVDYNESRVESFPALEDVVRQTKLENTVRDYYDENDVRYPASLFIARSFGTEQSPEGKLSDDPPYALHYDKLNKFKFFFYLTDVAIDHGPTHFAPGLHDEVKEQRLNELDEGKDYSELSNKLEDVRSGMTPVIAEAGTLLIFDTDVPHKAGGLSEGSEREVLRIDSLSPLHSGRQTGIIDSLKKRASSLIS
jgi:ectoine hydroxylase-related dioxygenase (phytanoyl-CoA dioxygenase family)